MFSEKTTASIIEQEESQFLEGLAEFAADANKAFDRALGIVTNDIPSFEKSLENPNARVIGCFGSTPPKKLENIRSPHLKIYILIRESVAIGHAVNCAAHASLKLYLDHWDDDLVAEWVKRSFRKVTCKVSDAEFEAAKKFGRYVLVTEEKLPQPEVALAFLPRREWDDFFKTLNLYA